MDFIAAATGKAHATQICIAMNLVLSFALTLFFTVGESLATKWDECMLSILSSFHKLSIKDAQVPSASINCPPMTQRELSFARNVHQHVARISMQKRDWI